MPANITTSIVATSFEESALQILKEFLDHYFSGGVKIYTELLERGRTVEIGMEFPAAAVHQQQSPVAQEMEGGAITVLTSELGENRVVKYADGTYTMTRASFLIFFRSSIKLSRDDNHNSNSYCQWMSDMGFAVLNNKQDCLPLARRGIIKPRPTLPKIVVNTEGYSVRKLSLKCMLKWPHRVVPKNARRDSEGQPILDSSGNYIIDTP